MVFYALHLFVNLRGLMAALGGIFVFVGVMRFIENDIRGTSYKVKPNLIAGSICLILMLILPSKETLLLMKASEFVTYDNAQLTVEALKTAIDYAATLF
jgi:hypothetical protein